MPRPLNSMLPSRHRRVLPELSARLTGTGIEWAVTGSACLALQGVVIEPSDIDILTTRRDVYRFPSLFADYLETGFGFSRLHTLRSHFGVLRIRGIRVEVMADPEDWHPGAGWKSDLQAGWQSCRRHVHVDDLTIPVLSLAFEHRVYETLGERAKVRRISELYRWREEHRFFSARVRNARMYSGMRRAGRKACE